MRLSGEGGNPLSDLHGTARFRADDFIRKIELAERLAADLIPSKNRLGWIHSSTSRAENSIAIRGQRNGHRPP